MDFQQSYSDFVAPSLKYLLTQNEREIALTQHVAGLLSRDVSFCSELDLAEINFENIFSNKILKSIY